MEAAVTGREAANRQAVKSFFCPYAGEDSTSEPSEEHVLTEALTSGGGIRIQVRRDLNSRLGDEVDSPFVNSPALRYLRSTRFVTGKNGDIGSYEHKAQIPFEGHELDTKINKSGKDLEIVPRSWKFDEADGSSFYAVVGKDEADGTRALRALEKKLIKKGKIPVGDPVRVQVTHTLPKRETFTLSPAVPGRFFAKVALGAGFFILGEKWARESLHAQALRRVLFEGCDHRGPIFDMGFTRKKWESLERPEERLFIPAFDAQPDEHEVAVGPGDMGGTYLYVNLFGVIGGRVRIATRAHDPVGYAVNYKTGELRRMNYRAKAV